MSNLSPTGCFVVDTHSRPVLPPFGSAAAWCPFCPDQDHRWWQRAMDRMIDMPEAELGGCDIAELNLICAFGLPGGVGRDESGRPGNVDIRPYLERLDDWAQAVREATERYAYRFERNPSEFKDSEAYFRILVMVTVLQKDLGVRYDPNSREGHYDARDARPWFIHGVLDGVGGTCVSMPILYAAIGR